MSDWVQNESVSKNQVLLPPVYSRYVHVFTGYFDSGSVRSSERIFQAVRMRIRAHVSSELKRSDCCACLQVGKRVGMTVGPWQHGSRTSCSPFALGYKPCFDIFGAAVCQILSVLARRDVEPCCENDFVAITAIPNQSGEFHRGAFGCCCD